MATRGGSGTGNRGRRGSGYRGDGGRDSRSHDEGGRGGKHWRGPRGGRGGGRGGRGGGGRGRGKIVLLETTAPLDSRIRVAMDSPIELQQIPCDLSWKFTSNPDAPRYWVKLKSAEVLTAQDVTISEGRKAAADQHKTNLETLKQDLDTLFRNSLKKQNEYELWCEARFGKSAWRGCETELHKELCVEDVGLLGLHKKSDFCVRTTTRTEDMIKSLCSITDEEPRDSVVLTVKDITVPGYDDGKYKITIDKGPKGIFVFNEDDAFHHYSNHLGRVTADFICVGRSYDVRICSTCKYQVSSSSKPPQVIEDVRKIADSMHQVDNGKLKMILKCGCVEVKFVRQMKRWNIRPEVGHHGVHFYEVKETNAELLDLKESESVELEHHDNQEIEVKVIRNVNKDHKIDEILQEVEELVDYAMDVVDKAERCKDPEIPY